MVNNNTNTLLAIVAICIIAISCVSQNIDGNLLGLSIAAIAGLGGFELYQRRKEDDEPEG